MDNDIVKGMQERHEELRGKIEGIPGAREESDCRRRRGLRETFFS